MPCSRIASPLRVSPRRRSTFAAIAPTSTPWTSPSTRACRWRSTGSAGCPCSTAQCGGSARWPRTTRRPRASSSRCSSQTRGSPPTCCATPTPPRRARPLRVRSIRATATLAGRRAVARLALEAATCRFFERAPGNGGHSIGQLAPAAHAATVATCAHAVAARAGAPTDTAHLAGLLHDVGKLVLPLAYGSVATDADRPRPTPPAPLARRSSGRCSASTTRRRARWCSGAAGVDEVVEEAIAAHHGGPGGHAVPSPEAASSSSPTTCRRAAGARRTTTACSASRCRSSGSRSRTSPTSRSSASRAGSRTRRAVPARAPGAARRHRRSDRPDVAPPLADQRAQAAGARRVRKRAPVRRRPPRTRQRPPRPRGR